MTTIELDFPIKVDGNEVTELEMRRPKLRDHLWLKAKQKETRKNQKMDELDSDIAMFARLLDVDESVLGQLDMADWGKLGAAYTQFTEASTPSQSTNETD